MAHTYTQIADELLERIYEISLGKISSYSFSGRQFTYHNLKELIEIEQTIRSQATKETYGCVTLADVRSY